MPVDVDAPPTKDEQNHRQAGLSNWMAGLKKELPNPSVGAGATEQPTGNPATEQTTQPAADATATAKSSSPAAVPAAAPAKPAEVKPNERPDEKWPRSRQEWKNHLDAHQAKTDELQKQITERDAKIKEFEAKAAAPVAPEIQKQIDALNKENEEFSRQLRLVSVTNHPRFKQYFETKTTAALAPLKSVVPADQLERVTQLVQAGDSEARNEEISKLLEEMSPLQQGRLLGVINNLSAIQAERDSEITRSQHDYEQMVAQGKAQQEQRQAQFNSMLDTTIKTMQDAAKGRPEYQLREGETEWNASVQKRIEAGRKLIAGNLAPEIMFKAAFDAAAYPDVLEGYRAALGEVEKLKKQIETMSARNPTVQSPKRADTTGTGTTHTQLPKDYRPMDMTKDWVKKFGSAMQGEAQ